AEGPVLDAAGIAGVVVEHLVAQLVAGHLHLGGVDDDDVVAAIHVRRVGRLVLAAQAVGDDAGETAENDAVGIDHEPLLGDLGGLGGIGLHAAGLVPGRRANSPASGKVSTGKAANPMVSMCGTIIPHYDSQLAATAKGASLSVSRAGTNREAV